MQFFALFFYFPRFILLKLIRVYQKTLSPDHGPFSLLHPHGFCKFHPTCSEYGYQAIEKYGMVFGGVKAVWRIARCHPWSRGGHDPLA